jgi:RNA polymerase subunit RPABC4/transcription elongation factor Spt4
MIEPDEDDDWWKRGPARDEDLDDEDLAEDADEETAIPCPHCGEDVYDDTEQCPTCGTWLLRHGRAATGWRNWFVVTGVVVALLTILTWIFCWR